MHRASFGRQRRHVNLQTAGVTVYFACSKLGRVLLAGVARAHAMQDRSRCRNWDEHVSPEAVQQSLQEAAAEEAAAAAAEAAREAAAAAAAVVAAEAARRRQACFSFTAKPLQRCKLSIAPSLQSAHCKYFLYLRFLGRLHCPSRSLSFALIVSL